MRLPVEDVIDKYRDPLFAAAFNVCRNRMDAEDAAQDAFIKYFSLNREYESEAHIRAWLLRVAINRAKDISASFWRRNKVEWEEYMETLEFEAPGDSRIFEAVMRLPEKQRIAIHLFYMEEYSVREIAHILQSREGTVKSQLSRGRTLLKTMLKEEWDDDE